MGDVNAPILSFNAGMVSPIALARTDLAKMQMAMEDQTNWFPKVLGPTIMRPGTEMLTTTLGDQQARMIPFVFNVSQKAVLELTSGVMRVLLDGQPLTRLGVGVAVPAFSAWSNIDEPGAVSTNTGGALVFSGTGQNFAGQRVLVSVTAPGQEHALRIVVGVGPVILRVGSASGLDDLISETPLRAGVHSLAFTPGGGGYWIDLKCSDAAQRAVSSVTAESAGQVLIGTRWNTDQVQTIRYAQSGNVLFCAAEGVQQQRIERRSQRSWSVVNYTVGDGPFRSDNLGPTVLQLTSSGLMANRPLFSPAHVGALFRLTTTGQGYAVILGGGEQWTSPVRVTGVSSDGSGSRQLGVTVSGTWSGFIRLQRSVGVIGAWENIPSQIYSANGAYAFDDGYDNQIIYYRAGFRYDGYTSGSANVGISYGGGSQVGILRVGAFVSTTLVIPEIVTPPTGAATSIWAEGEWSAYRGWPSTVAFHDGRLFWGRSDFLFGSISDAYESYDDTQTGDAGPISRSIATGGFDAINWILPLQRLMAGTDASEVSIRSSSFDEPLTPTAFTARNCSTRGSTDLPAQAVDSRGIFVHRNKKLIFELVYDVNSQDYTSRNLTRLHEDICLAGVRDMAVQRAPDTRVWFVLNDGTCAVLTYERDDEVVAWTRFVTPGQVGNICILPGDAEDEIYITVLRTIGGVTHRYIERLAPEAEAVCDALNRTSDCHAYYSNATPTSTISAPWLAGAEVVIWADFVPLVTADAPLTVPAGGLIELPGAPHNNVCVGLAYDATMKTAKLAYGASKGSALMQRKRVDHVGLIAARFCPESVKAGRDPDHLMRLWTQIKGRALAPGEVVLGTLDDDMGTFGGAWDTDSRVCLEVQSPYGCTLMGMVVGMSTNEHGVGGGQQQQTAAPSAPSKRS